MEISDDLGQRDPDQSAIALLSPDGNILFFSGSGAPESLIQEGKRNAVMVNGTMVGTVYVDRWESTDDFQLKKYVLEAMHTQGIWVPALTGIIALLLGSWLTRKLTQPLKRLIPAIQKIAVGELDIHIPVSTKDEIGKVTQAINDMSQQLLRAEEVRKNLTADVAHELRTPLAIIQSYLERIIDILKPEAEERHIDIVCSNPAQHVNALVDPNRITQVFYNLLVNALRYTSSGGKISIRITHSSHNESRFASVLIADTGAGIAAEQLPFLFDRFYRIEESRSRHTGGMGLGLAIAKEFVEAHRGFIEVQSEVGHGTQFTVYLPCA